MTHETTAYTDSRCEQIERNLGSEIAAWANTNLAGWVLDLLVDNRLTPRGVWTGLRVCDVAANGDILPAGLKALATAQVLRTHGDAFQAAEAAFLSARR